MFYYQSGLLLCTSILGGLKVITNKVHQPKQNMRYCGSMETQCIWLRYQRSSTEKQTGVWKNDGAHAHPNKLTANIFIALFHWYLLSSARCNSTRLQSFSITIENQLSAEFVCDTNNTKRWCTCYWCVAFRLGDHVLCHCWVKTWKFCFS